MTEEQKSLQWLSTILDILRKECPWDSIQTVDTLRYLTIEEVFELSDTIAAKDYEGMRKELGDLFMHLMFYSKIADDEGQFSTVDVIDGICKKLISRHPHIGLPDREGTIHPATAKEAPQWEKVKMKEGRHSVMEGVSKGVPTVVKAQRLQEKAAGIGFEFEDAEGAHTKVKEEYSELLEALSKMHKTKQEGDKDKAEEELGDLLFAIINWARMEGLNADNALAKSNLKFVERFIQMEQIAEGQGKNISDLTKAEMITLWNEAKTHPITKE